MFLRDRPLTVIVLTFAIIPVQATIIVIIIILIILIVTIIVITN